MMTTNYQVGDTIEVSDWGSYRHTVLVTEVDDDIKNGRAGYAGVLLSSTDPDVQPADYPHGVWGYDDQVLRVLQRAS